MTSAADFFPKKITMKSLENAAEHCKGCHLYKNATQVVFGEGSPKAKVFIVGEIPGDKEDQIGHPFVGPAGNFLRRTLEESNLHYEDVYLTNVVKHFKFYYKGTKRMHRSPIGLEINACKPWLDAEIELIQPQVVVCLGSTAAKTLISKKFIITTQRGKWFNFMENKIIATYHPSALLRAPDEDKRHIMKKLFSKDIQKVAKAVGNY